MRAITCGKPYGYCRQPLAQGDIGIGRAYGKVGFQPLGQDTLFGKLHQGMRNGDFTRRTLPNHFPGYLNAGPVGSLTKRFHTPDQILQCA